MSEALVPQTLRLLLQHCPIPVGVVDAGTGCIDCANDAFAQMLGCSPDALAGRPLRELHADHDQAEEKVQAACGALLDRGVAEVEWDLRHTDGHTLGAALCMAVVVKGPPCLALMLLRDVTSARHLELKRRQNEHELQAERDFCHALLENLSEGVVACDRSGRLILLNSVSEKYYGLKPDPVPMERWAEHYGLYTADGQSVMSLQQVPLYRALQGEVVVGEPMVLRPEGHPPRHVLVNCSPIVNAAGEQLGAVCVDYNITELRQANEQAKRLAAIVEQSGDAIIGLSTAGKILSWNRGAALLYRYQAGEIVGQDCEILVPPDHRAELRKHLQQAQQEQEVARQETTHVSKDGQLLPVSVSMWPVCEKPGTPAGLSMLCQDITRQRRRQEQWFHDEKMRSIATLAGGVAHDFNNILVSVLGNASMIQSEMSPEHKWFPAISAVVESAEKAATITRQLLAYSRGAKFAPQCLSLSAVIADALPLCRSILPGRARLQFESGAPDDLVLLDPAQMQQMLLNLTLNAAEAMPNGGRILIRTFRETGPQDSELAGKPCACLTVEDEGCGVDPDIADMIYEPFSTKKELGRGLGLASVYGMLKNHGGHIRLLSSPGEGAKFAIYFPLQTALR